MTQAQLADAAGVSRRWLSSLEAGKSTAEIGLVLRTLDALGLSLDAHAEDDRPASRGSDPAGLDVYLDALRRDLSDTAAVFRAIVGERRPVPRADDAG